MNELVFTTFFAASLTALATGLGALPFIFVRDLSARWQGRAAALAGGMMLSASVFSLSGEALRRGQAWELALGMLAGALFLSATSRLLEGRHWKISGLSEEGSHARLAEAAMGNCCKNSPDGNPAQVGQLKLTLCQVGNL